MTGTDVRLSDAELPSWDGVLPPWPGEQVDGLFVRRSPAAERGEPALFVHGLGGASTNWTDLMALLAGRLDGWALDLPGFGRSAPPADGSYALRTHLRVVVRLLEDSGRGPVHLFGNSLGGAVATRVAARRPDLVKTLTLVSPALPSLARNKGADPRLPLLLLPGLSALASRAMARRTPQECAEAVIALCYGDPAAVPEQRRREAIDEVARRAGLGHADTAFTASLRGLVGTYLERGRRNLWQEARAVRAPTLLVWGTEDRLVDVALPRKDLAQ